MAGRQVAGSGSGTKIGSCRVRDIHQVFVSGLGSQSLARVCIAPVASRQKRMPSRLRVSRGIAQRHVLACERAAARREARDIQAGT